MPTAMGPKKNKNEQISVGHFCGKHAMGAGKTEISPKKIVGLYFFVATYGNEVISVDDHKKIQTYKKNISVGGDKKRKYRPMELFTPSEALYKTCVGGASEDEMCPRWAK